MSQSAQFPLASFVVSFGLCCGWPLLFGFVGWTIGKNGLRPTLSRLAAQVWPKIEKPG